jgi:hypothetical protein
MKMLILVQQRETNEERIVEVYLIVYEQTLSN